jgi:hypothetical protein
VIKNTYKGWKSSLVGILIIVVALYSVIKVEQITWWPDALAAITFGVVLLLSPDSILSTSAKFIDKLKLIILVPVLVLMASCATKKQYVSTAGQTVRDTVRMEVEHFVPADSVELEMDLLSLQKSAANYEELLPVIKQQGRAKLTVRKTESGLNLRADCDPIIINDTVTKVVEVPVCRNPQHLELEQRVADVQEHYYELEKELDKAEANNTSLFKVLLYCFLALLMGFTVGVFYANFR